MDRGVKIAIFVASIMSLGLGLIWDQVLSHARVIVDESSTDELAAEVINARMGSPDIDYLEIAEDNSPAFDIQPVSEPAATEPGDEPKVESDWTDYTVRKGDSWWGLAHVVFKDRGLSSSDIENANKGKVLRPGEVLRIPPDRDALNDGVPAETQRSTPVANSGGAGETEYVVQNGDSWWKIANEVFKDRELTSEDVANANPGVKLVAGKTIKIPPGK